MSMDFLRYEKEFPSFLISLCGEWWKLRISEERGLSGKCQNMLFEIFSLFLHISSLLFSFFIFFHSNHTCKKKLFRLLCVVGEEITKWLFSTWLSFLLSHTGSILFREAIISSGLRGGENAAASSSSGVGRPAINKDKEKKMP